MPIFHIARRADWDAALQAGTYKISTLDRTLDEVGFMHCSFKHQVIQVADFVFKEAEDLVVLEIEPSLLEAEVRVENLHGGEEEFPHIYGPVSVQSVVRVHELKRSVERSFQLPPTMNATNT
ncbi:MAG TPA: DUF952 domain-containing protein [Actinomycetota bacterium]|nr:DUF952 domain-containing protein [Actinomycetota bacterium]